MSELDLGHFTFRKNKLDELKEGSKVEEYFDILILKAYKKAITRIVGEGVLLINHEGELSSMLYNSCPNLP